MGDGSLITITANGSLAQHFKSYIDGEITLNTETGEEEIDGEQKFGFQLSSDGVENNTYPIGDIQSDLNNEADIQDTIYGYGGNQMLLHSDRITLNSKLDDIFISSIKDIHIGAGRHLSISTNKDLIIESEKTYLGNPIDKEMEPMVFGNKLVELLRETLEAIKGAQGICSGAPIPLADNTGAPGSLMSKIINIEQKLNGIVSGKHYVEPN